jgi:hypothetical protein
MVFIRQEKQKDTKAIRCIMFRTSAPLSLASPLPLLLQKKACKDFGIRDDILDETVFVRLVGRIGHGYPYGSG